MKIKFIVALIVVVLLAVGGYLYVNSHANSNNVSAPQSSVGPVAATITYTDSGFAPAETTVKAGDKVAFVNKSSRALQVDSDPHPIHTDDKDLNVGVVPSGQTVEATLTQTGHFGFHNHLHSSDRASITIQ